MAKALCGFILFLTCVASTDAAGLPQQDESVRSNSPRRERLQVTADGHPLTIWVKRPASSRGSVLLVHGRTWSALPNFDLTVDGLERSVMDAFNRRGYAAYALDQRGYGVTPRDGSGWLTPTRAAKDISIVLAWIHAREGTARERPVLVGHSRGAQTSLLAAALYSDTLSMLVLCGFGRDLDTPYPVTEPPAAPMRQRTTAAMAGSDFITPGAAPQLVIDSYVKHALAADPIRVDWRDEHEFNAIEPGAVRVPTLVIHGVADPGATQDKDFKLLKRLGTTDRTLVVLPFSDHAAHVEDVQPAWVDAIVSFIERPRLPR